MSQRQRHGRFSNSAWPDDRQRTRLSQLRHQRSDHGLSADHLSSEARQDISAGGWLVPRRTRGVYSGRRRNEAVAASWHIAHVANTGLPVSQDLPQVFDVEAQTAFFDCYVLPDAVEKRAV